jgi:hypothetical protein
MTPEKVLKHRIDIIRQGLKKIANVTTNFESLRQAKCNALLSLGDRDTSDIIETAAEYGWTRAIKINQEYCDRVIYQEKPRPGKTCPAAPLPWDILRHRVKDEFLAREYERSEQEKKSVSCPMKDCSLCRICISPS